jgi:hypothetical protein
MASNTYTRKHADGTITEYSRVGTQGRKKVFGDMYCQRLMLGDKEKIESMGYEVNDFVRIATHAMLERLENSVYTELVNT